MTTTATQTAREITGRYAEELEVATAAESEKAAFQKKIDGHIAGCESAHGRIDVAVLRQSLSDFLEGSVRGIYEDMPPGLFEVGVQPAARPSTAEGSYYHAAGAVSERTFGPSVYDLRDHFIFDSGAVAVIKDGVIPTDIVSTSISYGDRRDVSIGSFEARGIGSEPRGFLYLAEGCTVPVYVAEYRFDNAGKIGDTMVLHILGRGDKGYQSDRDTGIQLKVTPERNRARKITAYNFEPVDDVNERRLFDCLNRLVVSPALKKPVNEARATVHGVGQGANS
jgi:hypothetical protein